MKEWFRKRMPLFLAALACVSVIFIGLIYFQYISKRIFEDSTVHLEEIYSQVNRSFSIFVERNWGLLDEWGDYFSRKDGVNESEFAGFVREEQQYWGFSEFYFLSGDGNCMTIDGTRGSMELGESGEILSQKKEPVMAGQKLSSGLEVTLFAAPVEQSVYGDFAFDAIAITYNNADMANSLNVDAFSGKAKCFVVHDDGVVLLSTQTGGNVFENYLVYLKAASDLKEEDLEKIRKDWENGTAGLRQCRIGGVSQCILYQPVGYQDYILLSVVPQDAVSAGFLSVQKTTTTVLVLIFLVVGAVVITLLLQRSRKQARRNRMELQYRERMFDVLSNSVDDIFIMLDAKDQNVDYISPNIERLLGLLPEDVRKNIRIMEKCAVDYDVVIPKDQLEAIPLHGNRYWECEYVHQTTGERRWYRMTVYNMSIQKVNKYIIVLSDRTQEKQMNQKLKEALNAARSANEAKSNFLSNMSHDIRTPMNAIVGFSVLLEKDADQPDKVREYTRKITASSHHLLSLINDVLDMSKIESGKTSLNIDRFRLPDLFEELSIILMPQAKAKGQHFEIHVQGTPPEQLIGDKLRLNQILINLLSNAIKYTQEGGSIDFKVCELPPAAPQYAKLRFEVTDNGVGMSKEFQKRIFSPFSREINSVTNKVQGTGLGMAITKNLVDLMGGIIQVESQPGKGSTFTVELSFSLPEQEESGLRFKNKITRMLVADDEEEICLDIREMMRGTGVDVSIATDGETAVRKAVEAHMQGEDYHVILLDWKMPGQNGVETARQIRQKTDKNVPILVLTSYDWSEIEAEARQAGINAFMSKPFFPSNFWQTLEPLFFEDMPAQSEDNEEKPDENVMNGMLFLVAEDNGLNAEILTEMLALEGARCEVAVNGQEALALFQKSAPGYYDMVLMDVQMPVMNGYEATRQIHACGHPDARKIPIVAMTANTFAEDVRDAMEAGMDGHLAKPIDMNAVRDLVAKLMSRKRKEQDGVNEQ